MATWVRSGTGTLPSATNANLVGTVSLDNATAPGDFDPTAVNSVRIQWTIGITSGTFSGSESHTVENAARLVRASDALTIATVADTGGTLNSGTTSVSQDSTDSTIPTGFSIAEWQGAIVDDHITLARWTVFNQDMGPDGVTVAITSVTVTIDYTPAVSAVELAGTIAGIATATGDLTNITPIFRDTFTGTDGDRWNADYWIPVRHGELATISSNEGQITSGASPTRFPSMLLLPIITDGEMVVRWTPLVTTGGTWIEFWMRAMPNTATSTYVPYNGYAIRLYDDGGTIALRRYLNGTQLTLATDSFSDTGGNDQWVRLSVQGTNINVKVWQDGTSEPTAWTIGATADSTFSQGHFGIGVTHLALLDDLVVYGTDLISAGSWANSTVSGTLTVDQAAAIELAGTPSGTSTVTADIDVIDQVASTVSGTATVTADLELVYQLAGTVAGTSTVTSDLENAVVVEVASTVAGTSSVTADLELAYQLEATTTGAATVSGDIDATDQLHAAPAGTSTVTAALTNITAYELAGTSDGVATISGNMALVIELAATTSGTATVTGDLELVHALAGTTAGVATITGQLYGHSAVGHATVTADLTVQTVTISELASTVAGTSTVSGDLVLVYQLAGVLAGVGSASGDIDATDQLLASVSGQAAVTADLTRIGTYELEGTTAGTSTVAGGLFPARIGHHSRKFQESLIGVNDIQITSGVPAATTPRTYSIWSKRTSDTSGGTGTLWQKQNDYWLWDNGSNYIFSATWSGGVAQWSIPRPPEGEWVNIVVVYDSSVTDPPVIYVDGQSATVTEVVAPSGTSSDVDARIVTLGYGTFDAHNGYLTEFAIWDTALTSQEVTDLYYGYAPLDLSANDLLLYLQIRGESPEPDVTGNGYDGDVNAQLDFETPDVSDTEHPFVHNPVGVTSITANLFQTQFLAGASTGSSSVSGDIDVVVQLEGSSAGTGSVTADIEALVELEGAISGASQVQGNIVTVTQLAGTTTGQASLTAALSNSGVGQLAGTPSGTATVTGDITQTHELAGTTSGQATVTANVTEIVLLESSTSGTSAVTGQVTQVHQLASTVAGSSTVSATITVEAQQARELAGTIAGTSTITGDLEAEAALAGTTTGQSTVSAGLEITTQLQGSSTGSATVVGQTITIAELSSTSSGAATVSGDLDVVTELAATSTGTGSVTGTLQTFASQGLSSVVAGTSTVTANLTRVNQLAGSSAGTSSVTATHDVEASLGATVAGTSTASGDVDVEVLLDASSTGLATITGAISQTHELSATVTGVSSVTGAIFLIGQVELVANSDGTASVSGVLTALAELDGASVGTAIVSGTIQTISDLVVNSDGTATVTATLLIVYELDGVIVGAATVTGDLTVPATRGFLDISTSLVGGLTTSTQLVGSATTSTATVGTLNTETS